MSLVNTRFLFNCDLVRNPLRISSCASRRYISYELEKRPQRTHSSIHPRGEHEPSLAVTSHDVRQLCAQLSSCDDSCLLRSASPTGRCIAPMRTCVHEFVVSALVQQCLASFLLTGWCFYFPFLADPDRFFPRKLSRPDPNAIGRLRRSAFAALHRHRVFNTSRSRV